MNNPAASAQPADRTLNPERRTPARRPRFPTVRRLLPYEIDKYQGAMAMARVYHQRAAECRAFGQAAGAARNAYESSNLYAYARAVRDGRPS